MARTRGALLLAIAAVLAATPAPVPAQAGGSPRRHARGEDVYLGGPSVDVTRDVPADLVAAGGTVRIAASVAETAMVAGGDVALDGTVGDDVIAAGGTVVLRGRTGDDARLAGGTVRIEGRVEDEAMAAGGTVRLEREAVVGGRAWLAGGEVVVAGTVERDLRVAAGHVSIEGTVRGNVLVHADVLDIGATARIDGDVVHRGAREPHIASGAQIAGRVDHRQEPARRAGRALGRLAWLLLVPALFATGAVMIAIFPRFTSAAAGVIETDPWRSLGYGALVLVGAPLTMIALFVTGIGFPLGLVVLAGYPVVLLLGYLVAALFVGVAGARRLGRDGGASSKAALILRLFAALVVLALARLVPILGGLVGFAALLFGVGALALQLQRAYQRREGTPPSGARA